MGLNPLTINKISDTASKTFCVNDLCKVSNPLINELTL